MIYITCGFLRLICSVLLTVCSHFKVNLSIGQFISFQKEQRLLPVFPLLNATVRIIEPLATTFRKELLRIKCRFDSCRERYEDRTSASAGVLSFCNTDHCSEIRFPSLFLSASAPAPGTATGFATRIRPRTIWPRWTGQWPRCIPPRNQLQVRGHHPGRDPA